MGCCPTEMLPYCCLGITRPCNETIYLQMLVAMSMINQAYTGPSGNISVQSNILPGLGRSGGGNGNQSTSVGGDGERNNASYSDSSPYPWYLQGDLDVTKFSSAVELRNQTGNGTKVKPFCVHPWNSSACQDGFFYDSYDRKVKPCPAGKTTKRSFAW